ncbi:MAG TPA: hypothetical protein VGG39_34460 [Polyangiaceae bacterium]|jgi:hypothetical protein
MARAASQLTASFSYQRLITTLRLATMLCDTALKRPAARSVRVESNEGGAWDDHVETWRIDGAAIANGWQIKHQVEPMSRAVAQSLFEGFATVPFERVTLAIAESTRVTGVGAFGQLRSLTRRLCDRAPGQRDLNAAEKKWVKFIVDATQRDEREILARLANLSVEFVGDEERLRRDLASALAALYEPPVDPLADALEVFAGSLGDGVEASAFDIEQGVLASFARQRVRHVPTYCSDRAVYLGAISGALDARRAGRGLFRDAPALSEVWVSVGEQLVVDAEVQPRPIDPSLVPSLEEDPPQADGPTIRSALSGGSRHVLVAPVGAGKTEILARIAGELVEAAGGREAAPLPLFFSARTFADEREVFESARYDNPRLTEALRRLRQNEDVRWVALVDSFDEVAEADADALIDSLEGLGPKLSAILAATRPSAQPLARATMWTLSPWGERQVDLFLERWETVAADAVGLVRSRRPGLLGLLATPLTATLVVLAARRTPTALESRARLFKTIVADLFQKWSQGRADAPPWETVSRPLRALARAVVEGSDGELAQEELERILERMVPDRERATERAAEHVFGLLLRTPNGTLDFALRPVGEFLAGEALAEARDDELVGLAAVGWAEEPVRHAIGLMEPARASSALSSLLTAAQSGELRPLIVALRAATDRTDLPEDLRLALSSLVTGYLFDERSVWQGDRVTDVLVECMGNMRQAWAPLFDRVVTAVTSARGSRAGFLASRVEEEPTIWAMRLLERDAAARRVSIDRLGRWVDVPQVGKLLLTCMLDQGLTIGGEPPAIAAGRVLRGAIRDDSFGYVLTELRGMLGSRLQLAGAAAAVALHPEEADPTLLVEALRHGFSGYIMPPRVLEDLASSDYGLAALSRVWADWRSAVEAPQRAIEFPPVDAECPSIPVHARLFRAALTWVRINAPERAREFLFADEVQLWTMAIALAWQDPSVAIGLLERRVYGVVRAGLQRTLGLCAVRHDGLAATLFAAVETATDHQLQLIPGLALEELVRRGNARAGAAYARWVPFSPGMRGVASDATSQDLFERPDVRALAIEAARDAWRKATDGWIADNGTHTRLFQATAGAILRATQPAWLSDAVLRRGLVGWLGSDEYDYVIGAMQALRGATLGESERAAAADATRRWVKNRHSDPFSSLRLVAAVTFVESAGLLQEVSDSLAELVGEGSTSGLVAASAIASQLPRREARELSASVARIGVADRELARTPIALSRLVGLAPEAWADAVAEYLQGPPSLFGSAVTTVLGCLPIGARRRALRKMTGASAPELPWVMDDGPDMMKIVRPADALARFRFDAGLPIAGRDRPAETPTSDSAEER